MANDCLTRLLDPEIKKKLFGDREVPDAAIRKVVQDIETIKQNLDNGNIDVGTYKSRVQEYIKDAKELSEAQVRLRAENLRKLRDRQNFYNQPGFEKDVSEGFKAALSKSTVLANNANQSVSAMAAARLDKWGNFMTADLTRSGHMEVALSGQLDKEIYIATEALSRGAAPDAKLPKEAIEIATTLNNLNKLLYNDMRNAGIPVRNLEGRVTRQTHDIGAIRGQGFEQWWAKTLPGLDQRRTFGVVAGDVKAMKQIGQSIYNSIVSGRYGLDDVVGDAEVSDFLVLGGERSLADKLSERRVLNFKNGEAAYNYTKEFGKGNLMQNVYQEMRRNARSVSLFERFGDKPRAALEGDIERTLGKLKSEGNIKQAEKLASQKNRILHLYDQLAGTTSIPGSQSLAKIGAGIGTLETLSKLWNVGLRSASNMAGAVVELKNANGLNVMESTGQLVKEWLAELPENARKTWASDGHEFLTDMQNMMLNETDMGLFNSGGQKAARFMMKYNGQDFLNNANRNTFAALQQKLWAKEAGKVFKDLNPRTQASLLNAGIDQHDWAVLGKAIETSESGTRMVTPEAIARLTAEDVKGAIAGKGQRISAERYISDLDNKVRAYLIQAGDLVTTTAGVREQSRLNFGTQRGTPEGEFLRLLTRFKSFTLQSMNIGKKFLNSNPNLDQLEKGVLMSQGKDMQSLAEWIVMGSVIAYGADTLLRYSNGKGPKDPKKPGTWLDAMAKSGAGGTYVDFFAGEWDTYDFGANAFLGPTLGQVSPIAKSYSQATKGKTGQAIDTATKVLRSYVPFQQAVGMKQGLDWLQYDVIHESLNPGAREKRKLNQMRKQLRGETE